MLTLKQYIAEVYDKEVEKKNASSSELKSHSHGDWNVEVRVHAGSQAKERRPTMKKDDWHDFTSKIVNHIKNKTVPNGEHVFYSHKHRQGAVVEVKHERKNAKIITVLPQGASRVAKSDTKKFITEHDDTLGTSELLEIFIVD